MKITQNGIAYPNKVVVDLVEKINCAIMSNNSIDILNALTVVVVGVFLEIKEDRGLEDAYLDLMEFQNMVLTNFKHNHTI